MNTFRKFFRISCFFLILSTVCTSAVAAENLKNVLVTGGAGYVGSQTCKALNQAGYIPITYDNLCNGHTEHVKWGPLEIGDISDAKRLKEVISQYQPIAVIHIAAYKSVGESVKDPAKYYMNNLYGSLVLLNTLREMQIDKIIFSSTGSLYGIPETPIISENHPVLPINPYAHTKAMFEQILNDYEKAYGIHYISLRYFNAAGADLNLEIGERSNLPINLIPMAMHVILKKQKDLPIYGGDFETPDGTALRDYVHVVDLADAHVKALQYLLDGNPSATLNLGSGKGVSVLEVISEARKITQRLLPTVLAPRRDGDPPRLVADTTKAQKLLNWKPKYSNMKTIIRTEWEWLNKLEKVESEDLENTKPQP